MTEKEIENLDDYLQWEFNYYPYVNLTDKDNGSSYFPESNPYFAIFDPLEFFKVFYEKVAFIKENKNRPAFIISELEKDKFTIFQRKFLYKWLAEYFETSKKRKDEKDTLDYFRDKQLDVCRRELLRTESKIILPKDSLTKKASQKPILSETDKKIQKLIKTLQSFPDEQSRIKFLKRESIQYVLDNFDIDEKSNRYLNVLRQQIKNRESLLRLENSSTVEVDEKRNGSELTTYQTTLFFSYLFKELNVNCPNTEQAKIISAITGFKDEKIRQYLSSPDKIAYSNFVSFERDITVVLNLFKKLKINSITEKIEKDIERLETETSKDL